MFEVDPLRRRIVPQRTELDTRGNALIPLFSSDRVFEQAANAFAALPMPAYVTYSEKFDIDSKTFRINKAYEGNVVRRTRDDAAYVSLSTGLRYASSRHLISPRFDVLSDFGMRGTFSSNGTFALWIENVKPLTYNLTPAEGIGALAVSLQRYRTRFVDDVGPGTYHIHLDSANGATNILPRLFFKEVYVDTTTGLPNRVELVGPDERDFDVRYDVSTGVPTVSSFTFAQTFSAGLGIVRARATVHAQYSDVKDVSAIDDAIFDGKTTQATPSPMPAASI